MKILTEATSYTISASTGLADTGATLETLLKDGRTYKKSAVTSNGSITLSAAQTDIAIAYQDLTIDGSGVGDKGAVMLHATDTINFTAGSNPSVVALYAGTAWEWPCLPRASFAPANFSNQVTYHNNIAGMGEFIGRSVIRTSATVGIQPLRFHGTEAQLVDLFAMFKAMRAAPFFVEHAAPGGLTYTYYGWTTEEPKANYNGNMDHMEFILSMSVWGYSVR